MIVPPTGSDRRATARRRTCLGADIHVAAFLSETACRLRDVSLDGARIVVAADAILPAVFDLAIPYRNEMRRARLVWRDGIHAGLRFITGIDAAEQGSADGTRRQVDPESGRTGVVDTPDCPDRLH